MGAILLLVIVYHSFYPLYFLSIKDISNGKTIIEKVTSPGDNLWIVFINSVEGLPVGDHFIVNDNYKMTFTETIYQAPYAGYIHEVAQGGDLIEVKVKSCSRLSLFLKK